MMGTKHGRTAKRSGLRGFRAAILAGLALGAILCAASVRAQTASPARDAAPAAAAPSTAGAAVAPPRVAPPDAAPAAEPGAPIEPPCRS
jgi:hypothetical protein